MLSENRKDEGLAASMTVADNVTLSKLSGFGPVGLVLPGRQDRAVRKWLHLPAMQRQAGRGRLGHARQVLHLQHDVDMFLLDEPTRGIDVGSKAVVYRLIDELATGDPAEGRLPRAILMVSSYLPELLGVCDRVAVMCRGRLGPARRVEEVDEHELMLEATGSEEAA